MTDSPTAAWTVQQIVEAFPDRSAPRSLLRDRDGIYGGEFRRRVEGMGFTEVLTAPRSPWQNPFAENTLLRQQLIVAKRKLAGRVRWTPWQRFTIVLASRVAPAWREATLLIQPATILRWHRSGFRGSGGVALGGPGDHRRRVARSSARWRGATHTGVPSAFVASCSS